MPGLKMSVSATTRPKRPGEVEGRDYLFVDKARFEQMVKRGELLEWATVFDNRYGTPRAPVEAALSKGEDVLFDIALIKAAVKASAANWGAYTPGYFPDSL